MGERPFFGSQVSVTKSPGLAATVRHTYAVPSSWRRASDAAVSDLHVLWRGGSVYGVWRLALIIR